jgi:hypothetical protein
MGGTGRWPSFRQYFESTSAANATVEVDGVVYLRPGAFYAELDAFVGSVGRRFAGRVSCGGREDA